MIWELCLNHNRCACPVLITALPSSFCGSDPKSEEDAAPTVPLPQSPDILMKDLGGCSVWASLHNYLGLSQGPNTFQSPLISDSTYSPATPARPRSYPAISLDHLQSECCLLPSALTSPLWEAHPSRTHSASRMRLLTISVVAASAMCSHGLHTRYVCICGARVGA